MFDRIASRYDLLNRLISLGADRFVRLMGTTGLAVSKVEHLTWGAAKVFVATVQESLAP